ncbi:MAG: ATP-binding protein [Candidatus Thiodiazotropha sp.]
MIRNLIDNAIRYTPKSGSVKITPTQKSGEAILYIDDSGPGIPGDQIEVMFQRFRRGAGNSATGSGLGLSIVQCIVELHHAEIALQNHECETGLRVTLITVDQEKHRV